MTLRPISLAKKDQGLTNRNHIIPLFACKYLINFPQISKEKKGLCCSSDLQKLDSSVI